MAAVPVGYQAFHSLPRKAVTLLCFLLASAMVMGISVYVDSYSVNEWNNIIDIGPIAMTIGGDGVENQLDNIRALPGVERAAVLETRLTLETPHGKADATVVRKPFVDPKKGIPKS